MVIVHDVRQAQAFIAVVYKKGVSNKKWLNEFSKECNLAKIVGKPMYAIIEEGVKLDMLDDMPWIKFVRFKNDSDIPKIVRFIDDEVIYGGSHT